MESQEAHGVSSWTGNDGHRGAVPPGCFFTHTVVCDALQGLRDLHSQSGSTMAEILLSCEQLS